MNIKDAFKRLTEKPQGKGFAYIWTIFTSCLLALLVVAVLTLALNTNVTIAMTVVENAGYVLITTAEYDTINTKLDSIAEKADAASSNASAAVIEAQNAAIVAGDAVEEAQNAVIAAQIAAAKVDLFNSAEVHLFPDVTNVTVTLTAGNTNVWSNWAQIVDSTGDNISSKFVADAGYISDMYIYDHSAVDKLYCLEISYGDNFTTLARVMYHTAFKEAAQIKSRLIPAGEQVYYRMMCSGANGATAKVGFRYFYE